jgi:D-aminopeptidase
MLQSSAVPASRVRAREAGIRIGSLPTGPLNAITDVAGVQVGHVTLAWDTDGCARTGVTAILPHAGSLYREKVPAAHDVINAFGKAAGLTQVAELGAIETPIVLTNTFAVGEAFTALVRHAIDADAAIGRTTGSVNPLVLECNDSVLNDIRALHVTQEHVLEAIHSASDGAVAEGAVGAGTGMLCYQWKGGIGTASRILRVGAAEHRLGALVLANFGRGDDLVIAGVPVGRLLDRTPNGGRSHPAGSCIVVVATDAPLDARQLGRLARRAPYGLGRTGTFGEHGSGEYVVAFSTAERIPHVPRDVVTKTARLAEDGPAIDEVFAAGVEAIEEAVLNALFVAPTVTGRDGNVGYGVPVADVLELIHRHVDPAEPAG